MRRLRSPLFLSPLLLSVLFVACDDSGVVFPGDESEVEPTEAVIQSPFPRNTYVDVDSEVYLVFDRPLSDLEINRTSFEINDEPVVDFVHVRRETTSRISLVAPGELEYHRYYHVRVTSDETTGIPDLEWSFATEPGPQGLLWERADTPTGIDLLTVVETGSGYRAAGRDGAVLSSPYLFGWRETVTSVGVAGSAQSEDIVSLWPASRSGVLTVAGTIYVGNGIHDWMELWEPPENLWVHGMWGITTVLVGSLRDDPEVGFLTSSYPGDLTLTRHGQVMRAAAHGHDGENLYVAVGDGGSIYFSRDVVEWEEVADRPDWGDLRAVIAGFPDASPASQVPRVGVAAGATIVWSPDGRSWQRANLPASAGAIHHLAWDGYPTGEFLAVGENGTILRSTDGELWTQIETGLDLTGLTLRAMAIGPSRWVVVGDGGVTLISPPNSLRF